MAKSTSLHLHSLIHSLSRSEKRYFSIQLKAHESKHTSAYLKLFSLIDRQELYDEEQVIKGMAKQLSGQRFAVLKHRLYDRLLDALVDFSRCNAIHIELRHQLSKAQVLKDRGLARAATSILDTVIRDAAEVESHSLVLDAIHLKEHIAQSDSTAQSHRVLSMLEGELALSISNTLLLESEAEAPVSYRSMLRLCDMQFDQFIKQGESRNALEVLDESLAIWRSHAHLQYERPEYLMRSCVQAVKVICDMGEVSLLPTYLDQLAQVDVDEMSASARGCYALSKLNILLLRELSSGSIDREELQERIENYRRERWSYSAEDRTAIDMLLAQYYLSIGDSSAASKAVHRVLNDAQISRDSAMYFEAMLSLNMIQALQGDKEWLGHSVRSLKRYIHARSVDSPEAALFLAYVSDYRRARCASGDARAFAQLKERFASYAEEITAKPEYMIDMGLWFSVLSEGQKGEEQVA